MISQYFNASDVLVIVQNSVRRSLVQFELCAQCGECASERFDLLLLLAYRSCKTSDTRLLLLIFAMLYEEVLEQQLF
jgi:hypothetical protein